MKKLFSIAACLLLAIQCFGTGAVPINSPQTGFANFSTNGSAYTSVTNLFEPPFTYPPAMTFYLSSGDTNALPFTSTVTATNFIVSINTATNCAVQWSAYPCGMLIQTGVSVATANTNIVFPTAYVYKPVVVAVGSVTNIQVSTISATNFSVVTAVSNTVQWAAFGEVLNPGTQTVSH